jgi:thiamine pyrophosphokinase
MPTLKKQFHNLLSNQFNKKRRVLILGPLKIDPDHFLKISKKLKANLFFYIDGGIRHHYLLNPKQIYNAFSIGDGDSLSADLNTVLDIKLPAAKNYSDLHFVLNHLVEFKSMVASIDLLGFSTLINESRIDHLLFNLALVAKTAGRLKIKISMDDNFLFLPPGINKVSYKGTFSVISFSLNSLKITGKCSYQLKSWTRFEALSTLGLSNIASGNFQIENKKVVLLYFAGSNTNSCVL